MGPAGACGLGHSRTTADCGAKPPLHPNVENKDAASYTSESVSWGNKKGVSSRQAEVYRGSDGNERTSPKSGDYLGAVTM